MNKERQILLDLGFHYYHEPGEEWRVYTKNKSIYVRVSDEIIEYYYGDFSKEDIVKFPLKNISWNSTYTYKNLDNLEKYLNKVMIMTEGVIEYSMNMNESLVLLDIIAETMENADRKSAGQNRMGVSELNYDPYYLIGSCFSAGELYSMRYEELKRLVTLASHCSEVFY